MESFLGKDLVPVFYCKDRDGKAHAFKSADHRAVFMAEHSLVPSHWTPVWQVELPAGTELPALVNG